MKERVLDRSKYGLFLMRCAQHWPPCLGFQKLDDRQNKPPNTITFILGTPKKSTPNFGETLNPKYPYIPLYIL